MIPRRHYQEDQAGLGEEGVFFEARNSPQPRQEGSVEHATWVDKAEALVPRKRNDGDEGASEGAGKLGYLARSTGFELLLRWCGGSFGVAAGTPGRVG